MISRRKFLVGGSVLAVSGVISTASLVAHSGGTNAAGCHAGSKPYHCHSPRKNSTPRPTRAPTRRVTKAPINTRFPNGVHRSASTTPTPSPTPTSSPSTMTVERLSVIVGDAVESYFNSKGIDPNTVEQVCVRIGQ